MIPQRVVTLPSRLTKGLGGNRHRTVKVMANDDREKQLRKEIDIFHQPFGTSFAPVFDALPYKGFAQLTNGGYLYSYYFLKILN